MHFVHHMITYQFIITRIQVIDTAARCTFRGIKFITNFLQSAIESTLDRLFGGFLEDLRDSFEISECLNTPLYIYYT